MHGRITLDLDAAAVSTPKEYEIHPVFLRPEVGYIRRMQSRGAYVHKFMMRHPDDDRRNAELVMFEAVQAVYECNFRVIVKESRNRSLASADLGALE